MRRRIAPLLVSCALVASAAWLTTAYAGMAAAEPCGNSGTGSLPDLGSSSGSLGSSGSSSGSLGSSGSSSGSLGSSSNPAQGTQGPLPVYASASTSSVAWVTGPRSANSTFKRFTISGTDVGVSWDNGSGQTLMAFGDTFGDCSVAGQQWRNNVLLRSNDNDLANGISVPDAKPGDATSGSVVDAAQPTFARELFRAVNVDPVEVTNIPTAAISVPRNGGHRQFINFMSVRHWGAAGVWDTNFSGIAYSDDNGQTWTRDPSTYLINAPVSAALPFGLRPLSTGNANFQQSAYVMGHGTDAGYVYQFGTPNGRNGAAYLGRVQPGDMLTLGAYRYWNGSAWVEGIAAATPVVGAPITELSVSWSPYLNKYIMLDGDNGIRLRTADHPQGPWSAAHYIVTPGYPVLYAPMMQPKSPALTGNSPYLYFNASRWTDYNVMMLRTDLRRITR
ncbi:DUF4185 domain-containing protein [Gordonia sp. NPDC003429]